MLYTLQNLLLYSIPLRELAGFKSGIPFRMGEILIILYIIYVFFNSSMEKKMKITNCTKITKIILILIFFNLVLVTIVGKYSVIQNDFFLKYLVRNLVMFIFLLAVIIKPFNLSREKLDIFFKYLVLLQIVLFFIQLLGYDIKFFTLINHPIGRRFQGSASEAGYLPTLIAPALCYFRNSIKNKKYYYLAFLEIFMTFSSFGFLVLLIEILILIFFKKKRKITKKKVIYFFLGFYIFSGMIFSKFEIIFEKINFSYLKILKYSQGNNFDFSTRARNQQLNFLKESYFKFENFEKIFGTGTGSYYYKQINLVIKKKFLELTEEGHNLYWSTLHDRGLIGLLILLIISGCVVYMCYKLKKDKVILSFSYIIFLQIIHWKITGNMWLYFYWIIIAYIISRYEINNKIKKRRKNGLSKYYYTNI